MIGVRQPKTHAGKRAQRRREGKLVENTKRSLVMKGPRTSDIIVKTLKDLHALKKPDSILFQRKNPTRPFEDQSSVEFLCQQNDCSLFAYGSHSKKRPHNLILGRLFDFQVLDMVELALDPKTFRSMQQLTSTRQGGTARFGSKPCFVFVGDEFESNPDFAVLRSLILDYFRGKEVSEYNLAGLDRVVVCTAHNSKLHFRHYAIMLKQSGSKIPRVELDQVGPIMDFTVRRRVSAAPEVVKAAMRRPKIPSQPRKRKNIESGQFGDRMGRVHMQKQDLSQLALRKPKALKRRRGESASTQ